MQQSSNNGTDFHKYSISYEMGSPEILTRMQENAGVEPFSEKLIEFLNAVSKTLLADKEAKAYPDVITLAFWIRRSSMENLKKRFFKENDSIIRLGRGIAFHIAPSNVPVNYAYSLVAGLVCGNSNIVRIPTKDFPQVKIINRAIHAALEQYDEMISRIVLVRYGHDSAINDAFSAITDVRVIWGGDHTISDLRKSPLKPRATEITFADRYSIAVIHSDTYMDMEQKEKAATDFYNDTYLTDQNACTSPRAVIWMGNQIEEAKKIFWNELHKVVEYKYEIQGVQAVNKLASGYLLAAAKDGVIRERECDNLIVRMKIRDITEDLMEYKDNSGYFVEYDCSNVLNIKALCNDSRCQTISYLGPEDMLLPLVKSGIKGVDRVVPIGKTMDFDLLWDGYDLFERMTRLITIQ